jgi:hypothetical protein
MADENESNQTTGKPGKAFIEIRGHKFLFLAPNEHNLTEKEFGEVVFDLQGAADQWSADNAT